jgi:hypothetical protein
MSGMIFGSIPDFDAILAALTILELRRNVLPEV